MILCWDKDKGIILSVKDASKKIHEAIMKYKDICSGDHRFGGTEYKLGKREIGHVHGDHLVDIPFPIKIRNELVESGEAQPHHILPDSGWVSVHLNKEEDVDRAINLLKRSYEIATQQKVKNIRKLKLNQYWFDLTIVILKGRHILPTSVSDYS